MGIRVLGVDPGFGRVGIALVEGSIGRLTLVDARCIETPATLEKGDRFVQIYEELTAYIKEYKPAVASIEKLFFATNRTTAMNVSEARGVIVLALAQALLGIAEYSPPQIKLAVSGYGDATKQQVSTMVHHHLHREAQSIAGPDDVTDACAIAICHHHHAPLELRAQQQRALIARQHTGSKKS